jgi:hypothetical protein
MINIKTLNPIVQTQLKNDPFNYEASDPLKTIINVPKFNTIVLENDRKTVLEVLENEEFLSGKYPFYLQHSDVFYKAQELFEELFDNETNSRIYDYQSSNKVSIFLFFNQSFVKKARRGEEIIIKVKREKLKHSIFHYRNLLDQESHLGINVENIWFDDDNTLNLKFPIGIYPVIGGLNSVDSGFRKPNFSLIFGTDEYLKELDKEREYNKYIYSKTFAQTSDIIDSIDNFLQEYYTYGVSLYSIDKFDFKNNSKIFKLYNPSNTSSFYNESIISSREKFLETIISFLLAINRCNYLKLSREQFSSVMPHFYGNERVPESVKTMEKAKKLELKDLYENAEEFGKKRGPNLTSKHLIDYFLRDSIINFDALKIDPAKEILKAFKDQPQIPLLIDKKEIFSNFITNGKGNKEYNNFLNGPGGQIEAKSKIYPLL